jgi:Glycosyl hydrolase catalytic core
MTGLLVSVLHSTVAAAHARHAHHKTHVRSSRHARHTARVRSSRPGAGGARTLTRELDLASKRAKRADRILVADAKRLARCLHRHPGRCRAARREVHKAGTALADAQRRLTLVVYLIDRTARAAHIPTAVAPAETPSTPPQPPPSMWIGLNAGGWTSEQYADVTNVVNTIRTEESNISGWTKAGVRVIYDDSGPYSSGGVKAIDVSAWVSKAVAYVKTNPQVAAIEVLNEASGSWFWGPNAASPEEAAAYDKLLEAVHNAFVNEFGSARPLILASYGGPSEAPVWGERLYAANPNIGNFCDGVVVHPYPSSGRGEADRQQVEEAHAKTGKPVYATEVGWSTSEVTEAEQAQNITNFINWAKSTGYVADVDVFGYRDYSTNTSENAWGIETWKGRHKLAYAALAAFRQ